MNRYVLALGCVSLLATSAFAQSAGGVVEGAGVKVGEGTVLHPVIGVETGVVHNVFFEETNAKISGLLRVIAEIAAGSLPSERMQAPEEQSQVTRNYGDFAFRLEANAAYEEYLSSNDNVQAQRDFTVGVLAKGLVFPRNTWRFAFTENFERVTRPVNFESSNNVVRDINRISAEVRFKPQGRSISGGFGYSNTIDYFEDDDQQFANRIQHSLSAKAAWQIFPVTRLSLDASLGFFRPLGSESTRIPSMPLRIYAGVATALTVKTSLNARVGFAKGFYETGPDFTSVAGSLQLGYRFSPQARFGAMYEYDFQDSINANYFRDHALKARIDYRIDRFGISAGAELRFRLYKGVIGEVMSPTDTDRNDVIFTVPLGASYNFRSWIAATLDYSFTTDQTDFRYAPNAGGAMDDPSYTRQSLMLGVRAAY